MAITIKTLGRWLTPVAALAAATGPARADDLLLRPRVELRETYSDNMRLLPDGQAASASLTEVKPGFALSAHGRRLDLDLDYTLDYLDYRGGGGQSGVQHRLQSGLAAELVDEWLFLDAGAQITRRPTDTFGARLIDDGGNPATRAQVRTYHLAHVLRHRFGDLASGQLRYKRDGLDSSDVALASSRGDAALITLDSGSAFQRLGWGAQYDARRRTDAIAGTVDSSIWGASVRLPLPAAPTLALSASVGHERHNYPTQGERSGGPSWSAGLGWRPSPRTTLELSAGHRFYGATYALAASHRARRLFTTLSYNEDITTIQAQLLNTAPTSAADLLDRLWRGALPDPAARQSAIEAFMRDTGIASASAASINSFANRSFLQKSLQASMALQGARSTAILNGYVTQRQAQGTASGAAATDAIQATRQLGLQALWNWRLTPHTLATLSAAADRAELSGGARVDHHLTVRLALSEQLGHGLRAGIELRTLRQRDGSTPVRENAVALTLLASF